MSANAQKRAAGVAAAALVEGGMVVGLGTGSTAAFLVEALGARVTAEGLKLCGVATSSGTEDLARRFGVPLIALDDADAIDLTLDGADEIGPELNLIKGGGAALLREKLVWEASRRCVVIADGSKVVERLGNFPLPIEVVAFGHASTARRLSAALEHAGVAAPPRLRTHGGETVLTEGGNVIYDAACGAILDPAALAETLNRITGVVEHGLFVGLAAGAIVAGPEGVRTLAR